MKRPSLKSRESCNGSRGANPVFDRVTNIGGMRDAVQQNSSRSGTMTDRSLNRDDLERTMRAASTRLDH